MWRTGKKSMKRVFGLLGLLLLLLAAVCWYVWDSYSQFLEQPLGVESENVVLDVEPGMPGRAVISRLAELGLTEDGWQWRVLLRFQPVVLKAGEYRIDRGLTPPALLHKLVRGDVMRYRFTIVEGWTWRQLLQALRDNPMLDKGLENGLNELDWREVGANPDSLEGAFLPETYLYTRSDNAIDVLRQAAGAMQNTLSEAWALRSDDHPAKTPYELLILASIIERETALDEERAQVSGVFVRRLQKGMRLQTDPTVIYGLGENFDGDIRSRDLQTDTPYNTYTRHGLPPTPIAMPGRPSVLAAARPDESDALYFVADGTGGHKFSATLEEHQRGVDELTGKN